MTALVSSGSWKPLAQTEDEWRGFDAEYGEARRHGTRGLIDLYREEDGDAHDREYPPWAEAATLRADPQALLAAQDLEIVDEGITSPLEQFPVPVLLTAGELEDPQGEAQLIASRLPRGESVRLPGLGHGGARAASEVLVPQVRAFVTRWTDEGVCSPAGLCTVTIPLATGRMITR